MKKHLSITFFLFDLLLHFLYFIYKYIFRFFIVYCVILSTFYIYAATIIRKKLYANYTAIYI